MKNNMKGSALTIVLILVGILAVVGMLGYILLGNPKPAPTNSPASASSAFPTMAVKDFAPGIPMSQKTTIVIQLSDSSREEYIVPKSQEETFIKSLPEGSHVVSKSP